MKDALYTYKAEISAIHDGDTVHAVIDLGFGITKGSESSVPGALLRLDGCNARELEEPGGIEAREHLKFLMSVGTQVVLRTIKPDKYGGRYDATIELPDGRDLVTTLIEEGWVAAWNAEGKKPITPWPIPTKEKNR
jgi:endonuclease YncB( thermonuclease family)